MLLYARAAFKDAERPAMCSHAERGNKWGRESGWTFFRDCARIPLLAAIVETGTRGGKP
jgi:hypothetical protein